jgi:hypothetical protein
MVKNGSALNDSGTIAAIAAIGATRREIRGHDSWRSRKLRRA